MKRAIRGCFLLICLGGLLMVGPSFLRAAPTDRIEKDLTQKKRDLRRIKKELILTKDKEKDVLGKESSVLETLSALETDLRKKEMELREMELQLAKTQGKLEQTKNQIAMLSRAMGQTKEELVSRLTALYKMGKTSSGTLLLASQSYPDLLRMDKYLRVVIDYDARLIETHRQQVVLKERYQEELIQDQSQWLRSIRQVEKKREEIKKGREEKRALLRSIQKEKAVYQKVIGELEARAKQLQLLIEKLEQEKSLVAHARTGTESLKAKLVPPVQGKLLSSFKEKGQNGIEIQAPLGTGIRAVLPGKVLYADWFKGFGNIVIIDHGDHLITVYGYSSEVMKKAGDNVSQGEVIALVGDAGSLKGPCVYFEIRHRGKARDPMEWIKMERMIALPDFGAKARSEL